MPDAIVIQIADALVTAMKAERWSPAFTPVRMMIPAFKPEALDTLQVAVVPGGADWDLTGRGTGALHTRIIDIGFQQRVKDVEGDTPALLKLVEDVVTWLKSNRRFTTLATLSDITNEPIYGAEKLRTENTFLSVLRLTLKGVQ